MTPQAIPNSWNDIETTSWAQLDEQNRAHYARKAQPGAIIAAEKALQTAAARLDAACALHEESATEQTSSDMAEAVEMVALAQDELEMLRDMYAADPDCFNRIDRELDAEYLRLVNA